MAKSLILASTAVASLLLSRHEPTYFPSPIWTFLGVSSVLFIYWVIVYPLLLSPLRHLPTPKGAHLLAGHFPELFRNPTGAPQLKWVEELPNNDGIIRYLGLLNKERIMLISPKILAEALHQKSYLFVKPGYVRDGLGRTLGLRGILFAEGDEHRHQRKLLLPAFSHSHIKNLVPTFWSASCELVNKLTEIVSIAESQAPVIQMGRWCSLATLDIIGRAGFGYEFKALETASESENGEGGSELARAYKTLFADKSGAILPHIARSTLPTWFLISLPLKQNRDAKRAAKVIKRVSLEIIEAKKLEIAEKKSSTQDGSERDILSVMLNSGDYIGPDGVDVMRDQMMTFLAAGHETTATAMIWGLHLLSLKENYHMQARLRNEVRAAFPHGIPESVSYERIESLKYLRNVTFEVLRFFPPVPLTSRYAAEDTTLGGQFVPKGTHIVVAPWVINKSKALWGEDADVFRPDRWDDGQGESNYAFMTFLAGPRGCIGNVFAKVEYKCLMAALIGQFEFVEETVGREIIISSGVTAKPAGGMPLKVRIVPGW